MRIMYIMPRYHTNLAPTMDGWINSNDKIMIVTYTKGRIEDYSSIEPVAIGYSKAFIFFYRFYINTIKKNDPLAKDISLKVGIPPIKKIKKCIIKFSPDVVILREKNMYSIVCNMICKSCGIKTVLYNQSPLFNNKYKLRRDFIHRLVDWLTPKKRITPVYKIGYSKEGLVKDSNAIFAPFVMFPHLSSSQKEYFQNGFINILEIGKYEKRKNHFMMLNVFERLAQERNDIRLTIVGEKSDRFHDDYYHKLLNEVIKRGLAGKIILKCNLSRMEISDEYKKTDVFVLPSTGEPAAISHIEAMSYSIPAISSVGNGTADYIIDGKSGYIFQDNSEEDLFCKLSLLISSKENLINMGRNAYERIGSYCNFEKYRNAILSLMQDES